MKITAQELMEHAFVISIDDSRMDVLTKVFTAHNLPVPQRMYGVCDRKNKPYINCYLSHRNAILRAKQLGWDYVCVFEDDAYPRKGIKDELDKYLADIPQQCGVLILGYSTLLGGRKFNANFMNYVRCYGSHAYVVFKKYYDIYLKFLDSVKIADCFQFNKDLIVKKDIFFVPSRNLFIQFCNSKSMNGHHGYIWRSGGRSLTRNEIFGKGFPSIESLIPGFKTKTNARRTLPCTTTNSYKQMFKFNFG